MELVRRIGAGLKVALPSWVDLHVYGGAALAAYGVSEVWPPGGFIVMGAFLSGLGIWILKDEAE